MQRGIPCRLWAHCRAAKPHPSLEKIAAFDLAFMLKTNNWSQWFNNLPSSRATTKRLQALGITERWDDPSYKVRYQSNGDKISKVEEISSHQFILFALREFIGSKENRRYRPGRFIDSLKQGKKSVTAFIINYQTEIGKLKNCSLPRESALTLLQTLRDEYVRPGTSGARKLEEYILAAKSENHLLPGQVSVSIWQRDPWLDLTTQQDFYSSASLREDGVKGGRSKGRMGTFGYLRNKCISSLDFTNNEGRNVRARLAAATRTDHKGQQRPVLFVDAVEGRFTVKPRLIKQAIEDYALAAGFDLVFYFAYPLNNVPQRFVNYLKENGAQTEEMQISYVDAESREYLDAFGLPLEPFEYGQPRGRVIGYVSTLGQHREAREIHAPSLLTKIRFYLRYKILGLMVASILLALAWMLLLCAPFLMLPLGVLFLGLLGYETYFMRRSPSKENEEPEFVRGIKKKILNHQAAIVMDYGPKVEEKTTNLLAWFPDPDETLAPFFTEVMANVSIKPADLENKLKFMKKLKNGEREGLQRLLAALWPKDDKEMIEKGLIGSKQQRNEAKKNLVNRLDLLRRVVKKCPPIPGNVSKILTMQKVLRLDMADTLELVIVSPLILRGLRKSLRPLFACLPSVALVLIIFVFFEHHLNAFSIPVLYGMSLVLITATTYWLSMGLTIAPGVLYYRKTRNYLSHIINRGGQGWQLAESSIAERMGQLNISLPEYHREVIYEDNERKVRIVVRDKSILEGATRFLTSSDEVGSCIALEHFVSWALPSLLNDAGVVLADVYCQKKKSAFKQKGQIWMVAGEQNNKPVLVINSFEFNNDGAAMMDRILPACITAIKDVARRSGFKDIYCGISTFGRQYLDAHLSQKEATEEKITKIHGPDAGYKYYFDVFSLKLDFMSILKGKGLQKEYVYETKRGPQRMAYTLIFGILECLRGNRAKAAAFRQSLTDNANCWRVSL